MSAVWQAVAPHRRFLVVLFCCSLLTLLAFGIRQCFGLFLPAFSAAHGGGGAHWFGLAIALQNLLWGLLSPLFGGVADRWGAARVAAGGGLVYALGLVLMAFGLHSPAVVIGSQALVGLGLSGCGFSVALGAVGRAAPPRWRSQALGLTTAAGSFGHFALTPLVGGWLAAWGWGAALLAMAALAALTIPAAAGLRAPGGGAVAPPPLRPVLAVAFGSRDYWLLSAGFFVCGWQVVFIATYLPSHVVGHGLAPHWGHWALSLIGLFNIFGTLACGWLGASCSKRMLLTWLYALRSLVILCFLLAPPTPLRLLLFSACIGLLWLGTVPLTSGLVADLCGTPYLSLLYGGVFLAHQLGSFLGAWLGGLLYDRLGDYGPMWQLSAMLGLLAAVLHWAIREPPPQPAPAV